MTTLVAERPKQKRKPAAEPFTVEHFKRWASELLLDNRKRWKLEPFQEAFIADVFSGVTECWLVVPEGNGKTTLVAGLALYHCEFTEEGAVAVAGSTRDQAQVLYRQAEGFVFRSGLKGTFKCLEGFRRINHRDNGSRIQIYAADAGHGDGIIPTMAILDELHRHKSLNLYEVWSGKLDKRAAQVIAISTAGEPGSEFEEMREKIRQTSNSLTREEAFVRALSETTVLHEYAIPEDGDVEDLELVKRANPYTGITIDSLRKKRSRPTMTLAHWSRFTCNLPTRADEAAIQEREWFAQKTAETIPVGEPIWIGLDVGWKMDTTAIVPLWVRDPQFRLFGPATVLEPPRDGTSIHPDELKRVFLDLQSRNPIKAVVMDMSNANDISAWLEDELGVTVIDRGQSNAYMIMDYQRFMEALRQRWIWHSGDDGLTQHAFNAVARLLPGGDTRFDRPNKSRSGNQKRKVIDALIAAAMAHTTAVSPLEESAWRPL